MMMMCLSDSDAAKIVFISSIALLLTTLYIATSAQGTPLKCLGQRPIGRGLWSYLYHYYMDGAGVHGYDPILGSLSPPLRLLIHVSFCQLLWASICTIFVVIGINDHHDDVDQQHHLGRRSTSSTADVCWDRYYNWFILTLLTVVLYGGTMVYIHYGLQGVSVPAGPRKHKIQRQPKWNNQTYTLPSSSLQTSTNAASGETWCMISAQESYDISCSKEAFAASSTILTGEPAGRDIWSLVTNKNQGKAQAKDIAEEMASGGRSPGFNPSVNPNSSDIPFRAQMIQQYILQPNNDPPSTKTKPRTVEETIKKAVHFYSMLQCDDGHWSGDYGGPHFLMPGLIVAWYIMGKPDAMMVDEPTRTLMKHYIIVHQQTDGGWGTHIESPSTMFGTTLMYVALRLLGADRDDDVCIRGRQFIREQGGAVMTSSWAKFYLCLLGCMDWDGHNSVPPEMWLLPRWFPFHPGRMWCHARMVYLPMGYLYGSRYVYKDAETDPTVLSLRKELYCQEYKNIPWFHTRHHVADMDNYSPIPWVMKTAQNLLARYETWSLFQPLKNWVRKRGLVYCLDYISAEDAQTNYIDIGPVNKVLNMLSVFHNVGEDVNHINVMRHLARVPDYLWLAEDGMKMKGYNGSQCWDTSFAIQAIHEAGAMDLFPQLAKKAWNYLERCQILSTEVSKATSAYEYEQPPNRAKYFRHVSEGGWPFSTSAHGWPISDCTGEGLKGVLCLLQSKTVQEGLKDATLKPIDTRRLEKSVHLLLTYQNEDGGFATYENNRGFGWYESLNPSEVFGEIMIDYSYVELTMASLTGLVEFHEIYPKHRAQEIKHAIEKGRDFLKTLQRDDGSWYGNWACCFCYASWFGIEGLIKCGESSTSNNIIRGCEFLLRHQRPNGGWGEDFTSCYDKDYAVNGMQAYGDDGSGVVNTSWALMALSAARYGIDDDDDKKKQNNNGKNIDAIKRGVKYLMSRQLPTGDFPQEGISGVFNRACGITYTAYRNVFPIWALGRCRATYGDVLDDDC